MHFCHLVPSMSCLAGMCRNANFSGMELKQLGALLVWYSVLALRHCGSGAPVMHPKLIELLFSPYQPVLKNVIDVVNPVLQKGCRNQLFVSNI